jgi:hypothetical protein
MPDRHVPLLQAITDVIAAHPTWGIRLIHGWLYGQGIWGIVLETTARVSAVRLCSAVANASLLDPPSAERQSRGSAATGYLVHGQC